MKVTLKEKRDYNKKDYWNPVGFQLVIEDEDVEVLEAIKETIQEMT